MYHPALKTTSYRFITNFAKFPTSTLVNHACSLNSRDSADRRILNYRSIRLTVKCGCADANVKRVKCKRNIAAVMVGLGIF